MQDFSQAGLSPPGEQHSPTIPELLPFSSSPRDHDDADGAGQPKPLPKIATNPNLEDIPLDPFDAEEDPLRKRHVNEEPTEKRVLFTTIVEFNCQQCHANVLVEDRDARFVHAKLAVACSMCRARYELTLEDGLKYRVRQKLFGSSAGRGKKDGSATTKTTEEKEEPASPVDIPAITRTTSRTAPVVGARKVEATTNAEENSNSPEQALMPLKEKTQSLSEVVASVTLESYVDKYSDTDSWTGSIVWSDLESVASADIRRARELRVREQELMSSDAESPRGDRGTSTSNSSVFGSNASEDELRGGTKSASGGGRLDLREGTLSKKSRSPKKWQTRRKRRKHQVGNEDGSSRRRLRISTTDPGQREDTPSPVTSDAEVEEGSAPFAALLGATGGAMLLDTKEKKKRRSKKSKQRQASTIEAQKGPAVMSSSATTSNETIPVAREDIKSLARYFWSRNRARRRTTTRSPLRSPENSTADLLRLQHSLERVQQLEQVRAGAAESGQDSSSAVGTGAAPGTKNPASRVSTLSSRSAPQLQLLEGVAGESGATESPPDAIGEDEVDTQDGESKSHEKGASGQQTASAGKVNGARTTFQQQDAVELYTYSPPASTTPVLPTKRPRTFSDATVLSAATEGSRLSRSITTSGALQSLHETPSQPLIYDRGHLLTLKKAISAGNLSAMPSPEATPDMPERIPSVGQHHDESSADESLGLGAASRGPATSSHSPFSSLLGGGSPVKNLQSDTPNAAVAPEVGAGGGIAGTTASVTSRGSAAEATPLLVDEELKGEDSSPLRRSPSTKLDEKNQLAASAPAELLPPHELPAPTLRESTSSEIEPLTRNSRGLTNSVERQGPQEPFDAGKVATSPEFLGFLHTQIAGRREILARLKEASWRKQVQTHNVLRMTKAAQDVALGGGAAHVVDEHHQGPTTTVGLQAAAPAPGDGGRPPPSSGTTMKSGVATQQGPLGDPGVALGLLTRANQVEENWLAARRRDAWHRGSAYELRKFAEVRYLQRKLARSRNKLDVMLPILEFWENEILARLQPGHNVKKSSSPRKSVVPSIVSSVGNRKFLADPFKHLLVVPVVTGGRVAAPATAAAGGSQRQQDGSGRAGSPMVAAAAAGTAARTDVLEPTQQTQRTSAEDTSSTGTVAPVPVPTTIDDSGKFSGKTIFGVPSGNRNTNPANTKADSRDKFLFPFPKWMTATATSAGADANANEQQRSSEQDQVVLSPFLGLRFPTPNSSAPNSPDTNQILPAGAPARLSSQQSPPISQSRSSQTASTPSPYEVAPVAASPSYYATSRVSSKQVASSRTGLNVSSASLRFLSPAGRSELVTFVQRLRGVLRSGHKTLLRDDEHLLLHVDRTSPTAREYQLQQHYSDAFYQREKRKQLDMVERGKLYRGLLYEAFRFWDGKWLKILPEGDDLDALEVALLTKIEVLISQEGLHVLTNFAFTPEEVRAGPATHSPGGNSSRGGSAEQGKKHTAPAGGFGKAISEALQAYSPVDDACSPLDSLTASTPVGRSLTLVEEDDDGPAEFVLGENDGILSPVQTSPNLRVLEDSHTSSDAVDADPGGNGKKGENDAASPVAETPAASQGGVGREASLTLTPPIRAPDIEVFPPRDELPVKIQQLADATSKINQENFAVFDASSPRSSSGSIGGSSFEEAPTVADVLIKHSALILALCNEDFTHFLRVTNPLDQGFYVRRCLKTLLHFIKKCLPQFCLDVAGAGGQSRSHESGAPALQVPNTNQLQVPNTSRAESHGAASPRSDTGSLGTGTRAASTGGYSKFAPASRVGAAAIRTPPGSKSNESPVCGGETAVLAKDEKKKRSPSSAGRVGASTSSSSHVDRENRERPPAHGDTSTLPVLVGCWYVMLLQFSQTPHGILRRLVFLRAWLEVEQRELVPSSRAADDEEVANREEIVIAIEALFAALLLVERIDARHMKAATAATGSGGSGGGSRSSAREDRARGIGPSHGIGVQQQLLTDFLRT